MKLHFKAESPLGFHYKLQNISIKLPFANKYDIILMTNWTTACLCTADPQLFSHDLLTALDMAAAGYIFLRLVKNRNKTNQEINAFHNVQIYSVTTLRPSLETITPMISQSNTGTLMFHEMRNFYLCCTTSCVLIASCRVSIKPPFFSGDMQFLICCLSSVIFPQNIMWSLCCHFSTIDGLGRKWSAQLEAGLW